eukprot:SAG31_NODE_19245_length_608_cov_1.210216_1_plen_86_part_10
MADSAGSLPGAMSGEKPFAEKSPLIDRVPELPSANASASAFRKMKNNIGVIGVFQKKLTDVQEQYLLKMLGNTSFKHQHHHIFEKW